MTEVPKREGMEPQSNRELRQTLLDLLEKLDDLEYRVDKLLEA